jgi:hypothetical protein
MIWRLMALGAFATAAHAAEIGEAPKPWFRNGQPPAAAQCLAGADTALEARGTANLTLKCEQPVPGFVGVMQRLDAEQYKNRRVRFSALVKAEGVEGSGGLWMRIDDVDKPGAAFDNMSNRPIRGTTDWTPYSIVLDASANAEGLFFGTLMTGKGQLWISDWRLEVVGSEATPTGRTLATEPVNLQLAR